MALMAVAIPIPPDRKQQWEQFIGELKGPRYNDFVESRRRVGVRERTFHQQTPQGDLVIVTLEGDDPGSALQRMTASNDEFMRWFVRQVKEIHDFDLTQPPPGPPPELIVDTGAN